ncbi:DUF4868 domain-containing protein [Noviherbaspirillum sp. CPCC 100848]|uniref:DUF4868 domain-containing protein n=1 Tax=Noviherbaspirillum album TaxID=3080276 RepID=A0ABU6JJI9_9BURK|nr:DUF4868 domain-containing protein [Noviherbaspirillum sp. CPCC 100848]MEC4723862.1 DUF4868 domain-containing protein [Noviherbaspirillum sp. CPCC 100848]
MQANFNSLKAFDYTQSTVHLWIFKKSAAARKFTAFFVRTDPALNALLKTIVRDEMVRLTECSQYSYLAETNDNSCLATAVSECNFHLLKAQVDRPEPEHPARDIKDLKGAEGYVVKFIHGAHTVYAVKRSTASWKTAYPKKYINMIFRNGELAAAEDNGFSIEKNFDFYCLDSSIFISGKRNFEATMEYKAAYAQAFASLRQKPDFSALFTDMQPLITYVGTNSIQLRRMAVVEQKGIYSRPNFLPNLQVVSQRRGWALNFDRTTNQIIACDQTAKTIMQVLLDHRLLSEITDEIYDVPDAVPI